MTDISNRIKDVIDNLGLTKTEFARKLNVSQAFVSQLCAGVANPSDRTIRDICDKFNVCENWLRTGEGEMMKLLTRDEELALFMGDVMRREDKDFRKRLMNVLRRLEPDEWKLLEKMALKLAAEAKEDQAET